MSIAKEAIRMDIKRNVDSHDIFVKSEIIMPLNIRNQKSEIIYLRRNSHNNIRKHQYMSIEDRFHHGQNTKEYSLTQKNTEKIPLITWVGGKIEKNF